MLQRQAVGRQRVKVVVGEIMESAERLGFGSYSDSCNLNSVYVNLSNITLYVVNRVGGIMTLPPYRNADRIGALICRMEMQNFQGDINLPVGHESKVNQALHLNRLKNGNKRSLCLEERISVNDVTENRNGIFVKNFDVFVCEHMQQAIDFLHPDAPQRTHNDYLKYGLGDDQIENVIQVGVRVVDNEGCYPILYTVLHNNVMEIVPKVSESLPSGLYITGFNTMTSPYSSSKREDKHYTFEEVKKGESPISLFNTYGEALATTLDVHRQAQIEKEAQRKHDLDMLNLKQAHEHKQREWDREKLEMDQDQARYIKRLKEREAELSQIKAERDLDQHGVKYDRDMFKLLHEMNLGRQKSEVEEKQLRQKTILETIKTIGIVVTAGLTIYSLIKKSTG